MKSQWLIRVSCCALWSVKESAYSRKANRHTLASSFRVLQQSQAPCGTRRILDAEYFQKTTSHAPRLYWQLTVLEAEVVAFVAYAEKLVARISRPIITALQREATCLL